MGPRSDSTLGDHEANSEAPSGPRFETGRVHSKVRESKTRSPRIAFAGIDATEEKPGDFEPETQRSPNARLTDEGVREVVRRVIEEDQTLAEVGNWIGLSRPAIGAIMRGEAYADLDIPLRNRWPEVRRERWRENGRKGGIAKHEQNQ